MYLSGSGWMVLNLYYAEQLKGLGSNSSYKIRFICFVTLDWWCDDLMAN
jgi:hypothetical protein